MTRWWVPLGLLAIAAGLGVSVVLTDHLYADRALRGVTIEGAEVGGLGRRALALRVEQLAVPALNRPVNVRVAAVESPLTAEALGMRPAIERTVAAVLAVGRSDRLIDRLRDRLTLLRHSIDVEIAYAYDAAVARAAVARLAASVVIEPKDAAVEVARGRLSVVGPSQDGVIVDERASVVRIIAALIHRLPDVEVVVDLRRPALTTEIADRLAEPVAQFTTYFPYNPNRVHNIRLAAGALRGVLLVPNAVLSYNQVVGRRDPKRGYRKAPVLINNELVPGDGGGVCQVSSTLFNAALLADLSVEARSNHSRPVAYLAAGRDATVEYGLIDLRLRNTTGHVLYLWTEVTSRSLTITVFGPRRPGRDVAIAVTDHVIIPAPTHTVVKQDAEIPAGQTKVEPARTGLRARTVRIVRQGGVVVREEVVALNFYHPTPRTIKIGAGATPRPVNRRANIP
ncbi:MAG: VanW family protein [Armatimonadota bacterium]